MHAQVYEIIIHYASLVEAFWFFLVSGKQVDDNTWICLVQYKIIVILQEEEEDSSLRCICFVVLSIWKHLSLVLVKLQAWLGEYNYFWWCRSRIPRSNDTNPNPSAQGYPENHDRIVDIELPEQNYCWSSFPSGLHRVRRQFRVQRSIENAF